MTDPGSRFRRIDELFRAALRMTGDERARYLAEQCAEDPSLISEVEELLGEDKRSRGALDRPVLGEEFRLSRVAAGAAGQPEPIPDRIGRYRVIARLGEGGMGTVYEAEQENPKRKVALKVISRGMTSQSVLRRFEAEANLLARLQHPGIAQVYEAGVHESDRGARPYFAMELIRGVPLTAFARERGLGVRARLELLALVCDAVQHAHQRGVIHRDLKPANILVDSAGRPKILDFGVARAIDSDIQVTTSRTDVGQIVGTISYMSPEQACGDPNELDTRSDIYSLGVIAYELLADRMPYDLKGRMIHEAVRVIREEDPTPISLTSRVLRGDVETIVGKALEKDKARRYASASAFADDLRRYLGDQPIAARPPSAAYQIRKFAKRNKAVVAATVAGAVMLVAGTVVSTVFALRADEARRASQANEQLARDRLVESDRALARARLEESKYKTISELHDELIGLANTDNTGGEELSIRDAFEEAVSRYVENPEAPAEARAFYHRAVGATFAGLGYHEEAVGHLGRAVELYGESLGPFHPESVSSLIKYVRSLNEFRGPEAASGLLDDAIEHLRGLVAQGKDRGLDLADLLRTKGVVRGSANDLEGCRALITEAISIYEGRGLGESGEVGDSLNTLAGAIGRSGDYRSAVPIYERAIAAYEKSWGEQSMRTATVRNNYAGCLEAVGRLDDAAAQYEKSLATQRAMSGSHATPGLAFATKKYGALLRRMGRLDRSEVLLRESVALHHELYHGGHVNEAYTMSDLAETLLSMRRYDESLELSQEAEEIIVEQKGADSLQAAVCSAAMADVLTKMGRLEEAIAMHRDSVATYREHFPEDHFYVTRGMTNLALCLAHAKEFGEAEQIVRNVIATLIRVGGDDHPDLSYVYGTLAVVLCRSGDYEHGAEALKKGIDLADRLGRGAELNTASMHSERGGVLTLLGRYEEAEEELLAAYRLISGMSLPGDWTVTVATRLAALYDNMGDEAKAAPWRAMAASAQSPERPPPGAPIQVESKDE